ncbi:Retinol dehydrogenase 12 [Orchesella cincta]|uniref:Retinol dehydrogenase 12 n=1 Tax=Orchesella cincta TaxID=48709 RepID=A0A1D2NEZ6_ORCCI|nr:Retinol dehydrogenase 12 [Orchesella cincta]
MFKIFGISEMEEEPIAGKIAIVTGSNSGIGKQVAKDLAARGATVVLACRNLVAGRQAMEEIKTETPDAKLDLLELDLSQLSSVRKFATEVKSRYPEIHLLINNAGLSSYSQELQKTVDGFELHMGVNHLGHFLLTNLLLDNLKTGAPSRIVTLSSTTVAISHLKLDDLMMEKFKNPTVLTGISRLPYNNSKMANALFTKELARRLDGTGVTAYSLCPGVVKTEVFRDSGTFEYLIAKLCIAFTGVPLTKHQYFPYQASLGVLYCALSRKCEHESGKFYRFGQIFRRANRLLKVQDAQELWDKSEELVQLR